MADSDRLAAVIAKLVERDQEFLPFENTKVKIDPDEPFWPLSALKRLLGYSEKESIDSALNRAKISASKTGLSLKAHFRDGTELGQSGEVFISKYAAVLVAMNADVRKTPVAIAQNYFALQVDKQALEDEKRLKVRLDVVSENKRLNGEANRVGVRDFQKFNGVGVRALYGGHSVPQITAMKGLLSSQSYLDFAGSEELASNLFRITQTAAALRRQDFKDEQVACLTHERVAKGVRKVIIDAGNLPPEKLEPAKTKIDAVATQVKKRLSPPRALPHEESKST